MRQHQPACLLSKGSYREIRTTYQGGENVCKMFPMKRPHPKYTRKAYNSTGKKTLKTEKKKLKTPTERWANGDFPDGPVLRYPPSNAGDTSLVPGQGTEIPHALGQLSQLGPQPRPNKTETKQKGKAGKCVEETFLQKNTQRASRHMQKRPDSLILRETQVKTTARHHCTPVRMAVIKKKTTLCTLALAHCWCSRVENRMEAPQTGIGPPWNPAIPLLNIYPKELKS